jgi:membrane-associated protein
MYLMVFVIVMLGSTVVGGLIPNSTFLFLNGAVARANGLSIEWLLLLAAAGGFVGYEMNYWGGRRFGITSLQGVYKTALQHRSVRKAFDMMEDFSPVTLIVSRVLPVLNLPAFIAGVDKMDYRRFVGFNLISAAIWSLSILMLGYIFGGIPIINEYLSYIADLLIVVVVITTIVALVTFARRYVKRNNDMY